MRIHTVQLPSPGVVALLGQLLLSPHSPNLHAQHMRRAAYSVHAEGALATAHSVHAHRAHLLQPTRYSTLGTRKQQGRSVYATAHSTCRGARALSVHWWSSALSVRRSSAATDGALGSAAAPARGGQAWLHDFIGGGGGCTASRSSIDRGARSTPPPPVATTTYGKSQSNQELFLES